MSGPEPEAPLALVIDADPVARANAMEELRATGFRVAEADGAGAALAAVAESRPALVLLDVEPPEVDGLALCRRIRTLPMNETLPILVTTAAAGADTIRQAFEAGATDFVTKPLEWTLLRHRVHFLARAGEAFVNVRRTLAGLADSERRLSDAQQLAHIGNWQWLVEANQMLWSDETLRILGLGRETRPSWETLVGSFHPEDRAHIEKLLLDAVRSQTGWDEEHRVQTPPGELRFVHHQGVVDIDPLTGERRVLGTLQDITERRANQEKIRRLAYYDSLTGLPNRRLLHERLERMLRICRANGSQLAVMFVDVDRFKWVNDSLGHAAGDRLLSEVARRLVDSLRVSDGVFRPNVGPQHFLSRVGGDEFVITLITPEGPELAGKVARRILAALQRPCLLEGKEIAISASIGIALAPGDAQSPESLLHHADVAMYNAKKGGRNRYQFYTQALSATADRALLIQAALQRALRDRAFSLHYQPQISIHTGQMTGLEALVRWELPGKGMVPPGEFIAIAEETGLILPIGEWALERACLDCAAWQRQGLSGVSVAVNVSPVQLRRPEIVPLVASTLERSGLDARFLELELTESALLQHTVEVAANLDHLKAMGVRLALDDFGTGYASLSYLKRIPFDSLKIDREFIEDLDQDAGDRAIVAAIVAIARTFGLRVVAEGVETAEHERLVREEGCDAMQGYRLGVPSALVEILRQNSQRGALRGVSTET